MKRYRQAKFYIMFSNGIEKTYKIKSKEKFTVEEYKNNIVSIRETIRKNFDVSKEHPGGIVLYVGNETIDIPNPDHVSMWSITIL